MSKHHQIKRCLGGAVMAVALAATPAMSASGASATSSHAGATMAATVSAAAATATTKRGHGYRYRHRGYGGHYRGYYGGYRHYGYYGFPFYYGYGHHRYGRHRLPRYRASNVEQLGALDFDIKPKAGEVFLDGRSIGTVGQFDGFPDYLWLEKGTYDVAVYLDGYKTFARTYRIYPGLVIDVDGRLVEGVSTRPEAAPEAAPTASSPPPATPVDPGPAGGVKGRLLVSVWPADAAVYLDGHFLGVAQELGHVSAGLLVAAGPHTIEVARPGYKGVTREVEIEADERFELSVELTER